MNQEDIIRMAQEAQMPFYWRTGEITYLDKLERFAALVASAEREACAKVCEKRAEGWLEVRNARTIDEGCMHSAAKGEAQAIAAAIRARGQA